MSRALRLAVCIQEVEESIKEVDDRNQICSLLVTAMFTMYSADDRAHNYDCLLLLFYYKCSFIIKITIL